MKYFTLKGSITTTFCILLLMAGCSESKHSKNTPEPSCISGCSGTKYVDCEAGTEELCEYGCADNVCHHTPSGCTPGYETCADGVHVLCSSAGVLVTDNCPSGSCNGSACASQITSKAEPCKGVVCTNHGQCDRGICVSENMKKVQEGDECDAWFQGFCNGNQRVTCEGGKIHFTDCSNSGGCAMSKGKQEYCGGETYLFPTCRKDGPQCLSVDKNGYCAIENNQGQTEAHAYGIACWENTDDTLSGNRMGDSYVLCTLGCNQDKTGCLSRCELNDTLHLYNDTIQYCANNADICVTLDGEGTCAEPCHQKGLETQQCFNDNARHRVCSADDNGKLYFRDMICGCDHGCEGATGQCRKLVSDEYSACNWNTFRQRCDGKIRVACVDGRVRAEECSDACEVSQNAALCPSRICSSTEFSECVGWNDLLHVKCAPADSGHLIPIQSSVEYCELGCYGNDNTCSCSSEWDNWCTVNNEVAWCAQGDSWSSGFWKYSSCNEKTCAGGSCYAKLFNSQQECESYIGSKRCPSLFSCQPVKNSSQYGIWDDYGDDTNCGDYINVEWCQFQWMPDSMASNGVLEAYVRVYAPGITGRNGTHDDLNMYFSYIPIRGEHVCASYTPVTIKAQRNTQFYGDESDNSYNNDEYFVRFSPESLAEVDLLRAGFYRHSDNVNQTLLCKSRSNETITCDLYGGDVCSNNQTKDDCDQLDKIAITSPKAEWCSVVRDYPSRAAYVQFYIPGITGRQRSAGKRGSDISVEFVGTATLQGTTGNYNELLKLNPNFDTNLETNNDEFMWSIAPGNAFKGYFVIRYGNDTTGAKCGQYGIYEGDNDEENWVQL